MSGRRLAWAVVLAVVLLLPPLTADAAPSAEPWPRWQAHDAASTQQIDHRPWGQFLARHVQTGSDGIARISYDRVGDGERAALASYLQTLSAVPVRSLNRAEQLAYWINLYNALTVQLILEHRPQRSIFEINISPGLFARGPWGKALLSVEGEALSLNDIEHRILRPLWQDPRIHYAVNCASLGCPNLSASPYQAATLESQLEAAARAYVNHPRGVRIVAGKLEVSSIYHWFAEDFGDSDQAVIAHLRRYAEPALAAQLEGLSRIADHHYDWSLNRLP